MRKALCLLSVAAIASASIAEAGAPVRWYTNVTVKYVYSGQTGDRVAVGITTDFQAGNCPNSREFTFDPANPHLARIFSMLVAAQTAGTTVNIYTNGDCSANGLVATDVALGVTPWNQ